MEFPEKKILLKNGKTAVLRSPEPEQAEIILDFLEQTAGETDFLLRYPEECETSVEKERTFLRNMVESDISLMICCYVDGVLAGNCQLSRKTKLKNRHRGSVGIALLKSFWGLGIGTAMFCELIAIARKWELEQLELEVFEGNTRAMALYEKMGFTVAAATPNAIHLKDGSVLKEYLMVKRL